jgi:hypothetical protein
LAVNRLGEKGSWDVGELQAEFKELVIADAPIEISGFGSDEIDHIIVGRDQAGSKAANSAALPVASAIAGVGDLFLLGPHRVICGNTADPDLVNRLMRTDVARMVLTEAPFAVAPVAVEAHVTASDHWQDRTASGDITDAPSSETNQSWIKAVYSHLVDGGLLGTFIDWRNLPLVHAAAAALRLTPIDLVVWTTTSAGQNGLYKSRHVLPRCSGKVRPRPSTTTVQLANMDAIAPTSGVTPRLRKDRTRGGGEADRVIRR